MRGFYGAIEQEKKAGNPMFTGEYGIGIVSGLTGSSSARVFRLSEIGDHRQKRADFCPC